MPASQTINQALTDTIREFKRVKTKNPHLEAEILLSHALRKPRSYLLAHGEKRLTKLQVTSYELQVTRRAKGEPLAYITGHKEFYGLDFHVNKHVLIPRGETELMVEETVKHITHNTKQTAIVDVGTGSGCIIITLAKMLKKKLSFGYPKLSFLATDISAAALAVARRNAGLHEVGRNIKFLRGDLLWPFLKNPKYLNNPKNPTIILANLPYLTPRQIKNSPSIKYEPKLALSAGPDGLKYYRQLFRQLKEWQKKPQAKSYKLKAISYVLAEIDPPQTHGMKKLVKTMLPQSQLQTKKDLRGQNRLIILKL